jgi:hypothetical protein
MSPITRTATPAAVVLLLAAVAPARAERHPDDRCAAAILRASGQLANCLLQSDAGFVESEKAERYEKKVGRCEDGFARRTFSAETRAQVAVWLIGNEIAPDDPFTAQTLAVIKARAQPPLDTLPICVPLQMSSTADALAKVQRSHAQFPAAGLADRFIACSNFYGLGQTPGARAPADQLQDFIEGFFADDFVKTNRIALLLTEFGINFDGSSRVDPNAGGDAALQGTYLGEMLARSTALQAKYPRFVGQTIFEYTNESWKTPLTEQRFGLYKLQAKAAPFTGRTTAAAPYPIDTRVARPQQTAVVDNY